MVGCFAGATANCCAQRWAHDDPHVVVLDVGVEFVAPAELEGEVLRLPEVPDVDKDPVGHVLHAERAELVEEVLRLEPQEVACLVVPDHDCHWGSRRRWSGCVLRRLRRRSRFFGRRSRSSRDAVSHQELVRALGGRLFVVAGLDLLGLREEYLGAEGWCARRYHQRRATAGSGLVLGEATRSAVR